MTLTLHLSEEDARKLVERAQNSGSDISGYVTRLIERDIHPRASIAEVLAPIRQQFDESGMSDDDLDALVQEAREEVWNDKQAHLNPGR
jgi:hypothetical protein